MTYYCDNCNIKNTQSEHDERIQWTRLFRRSTSHATKMKQNDFRFNATIWADSVNSQECAWLIVS